MPQNSQIEDRSKRLTTADFFECRMTEEIEADIRSTLLNQSEIEIGDFAMIYDAALEGVRTDRYASPLIGALRRLGIDKLRAREIAYHVGKRAWGFMDRAKQIEHGVTEADWVSMRLPCLPLNPTESDRKRAAGHQAARGRRYKLSDGLLIDGKPDWPGMALGCVCIASIIPAPKPVGPAPKPRWYAPWTTKTS